MKKLITTIIIVCCGFSCVAQEFVPPTLTKQQMYEDFDYLVNIIRDVEPRLEVIKQVTGKNILSEIEQMQASIDTITTFSSFYELLERALYLTQDKHNNFTYYSNDWGLAVLDDTIVAQSNLIMRKNLSFKKGGFIGLFYINGAYYFDQNITGNYEKDTLIFQTGTQVLSVNGIDVDSYLLEYGQKMGSSLRWDAKLKKYYTKYDYGIYKRSSSAMTIKMLNGEVLDVAVPLTVRLRGTICTDDDEAKVLYFSNDAILYIRLYEMETELIDFYTSEIEKLKDMPIKKVVIDIRGNSGGSDKVWQTILATLIDKPIIYPVKLLIKNTPTAISYLNQFAGYSISSTQENEVMIGNDIFFHLHNTMDTISVEENTIAYSGNIYVLADERCFSSAGSLISVCGKTDRLISIGQPTGNINGIGINPFVFSLPHSKLIFWIAAGLEGINTDNVEDYYHNTIEILVEKSVQEVLFERNWEKELYGEEYLFNYDSTFQKVLELE